MKLLDFFLISAGLCLPTCQVLPSAELEEKKQLVNYLDLATELMKKAKCLTCPSYRNFIEKPMDCEELLRSGHTVSKVYRIWPRSRVTDGRPVDVYCDMTTDGGGWIVIQRRGNFLRLQDYFFQDWNAYKSGFGDIEKDFWLGNDNIFAISNQKQYSVRFDLQDVEGNKRYALYDQFWIDDEEHKYTLHITGYSGDAGDSMAEHNNQKFSTKDQDNDSSKDESCSQRYKGGWWYGSCHAANLNGLYLRGKHESFADGVDWYKWKGHHESMDTTEIKLRSFRRPIECEE